MSARQFSKEWFDAHLKPGKGQAELYHFLNERFGLDRTKVNKLVNGRRKPQAEELPALMEWLGVGMLGVDMEAGGVAKLGGGGANKSPLIRGSVDSAGQTDAVIGKESDFPRAGPRDVPVRQIVTGGDDGDFIFSDEIIEYMRRPPSLADQLVIAAYVVGDSMIPRFEPGEPVYAYVNRPAFSGDYVIIEMHPKEEGGDRRGFIKKLLRRSSKVIVCEQFNPKKEIEYPAAEVKHIYRIVPPAELFG